MTNSEKATKETTDKTRPEFLDRPWYRRRRYQALIVLILFAYFCLTPSCLRITSETTGLDDPILAKDGMPDYFAEYEKSWIDKLTPPEDNGQRLLIAARGPRILEQNAMVEEYSWEEIPTGELSKQWFAEDWIPLCEAMYIDPHAKPEYLDLVGFYGFVGKLAKAQKEATEQSGEEPDERFVTEESRQKLHDKLSSAPWTAEEYPEIAGWLKEYNPVLDLFGVAVRKPNFVCWRKRPDLGGCCMVLLPDVQANRDFARNLQVRIPYKIGQGDLDGAWYDLMSMLLISRKHYLHDEIFVVNLVGIAMEGVGYNSLETILKHGNPTAEQLERFAADLAVLPRRAALNFDREELIAYDVLYQIARGDRSILQPDLFDQEDTRLTALKYLSYLPIDYNIAGKRIAEFHQTDGKTFHDSGVILNSMTTKKLVERREEKLRKINNRFGNIFHSEIWSIPLIRTRSNLIADYLICCFSSAFEAVDTALKRCNANLSLAEIAIALERYERAKGEYPETLQTLVPKYLDEIPLDPFTNRKTLTYRRTPDAESPYLLYSFGPNGKDDNGKPLEPYKDQRDTDIVFKR